MTNPILYQPSQDQIEQTHLWQFLKSINSDFSSYDEIYNWSLKEKEKFWQAIVKMANVQFSEPPQEILSHKNDMEKSQWFVGAKLNFAEHLLRLQGAHDRFHQIKPKVLFCVESYLYNGKTHVLTERIENLVSKMPSLEQVIVIPYLNHDITLQVANCLSYHDLPKREEFTLEFEQLPFDHPIYILFSSGTTGAPKCIVHSAGGTLLQHLKELMLHTDLKKEDTIFYYTTCGWMMWNWLVSSLAIGSSVVLYDGSPVYPEPKALFDLVDQEKITVFGVSAKYLASIEKSGLVPKTSHDLSSLKTILSTGSPLVPPQFDFVYQKIKDKICLSSISGGSDIVSCFALGNPILPVYRGELQCIGLGMSVKIFDELGHELHGQKGELVCTTPFPAMPIGFWNDPDGSKYHQAYFSKFKHIWAHGDFAAMTKNNGLIIYGRSDATLNAGGVRIGTAEIYRQVEKFNEVLESIAVAQNWQNDTRIILFVRLRDDCRLDDQLINAIKTKLRSEASPHHVPAKIIAVADIPRTLSGKIVELAVSNVIHDEAVKNLTALANPEALEYFRSLPELSV